MMMIRIRMRMLEWSYSPCSVVLLAVVVGGGCGIGRRRILRSSSEKIGI